MKFLKYVLVSLVAILSLAMTVGAASTKFTTPPEQVALFLQLDPTGVAKPIDMAKEVYKEVDKKLLKVNKTVIPYEKAQKDFRTHLRNSEEDMTLREQNSGVILRTRDLQALAAKEHTRYVIVISAGVTSSEEKSNMWTGKRKNLTILTNVIIYDAERNEYYLDDDYQSVGTTSGSYERAYNRALKDMLEQVDFGAYVK